MFNLISVVVSIIFWLVALSLFPYVFGPPLGIFIGLMTFLFILPWIPGAIEPFMIRPNRHREMGGDYKMSRAGFFTDLQQGREKVKTSWNGSFIEMLMDYDGRRHEGEDPSNPLRHDQEDYWEVVPSGALPDSHPLPFPAPKGVGSSDWWMWVMYSPISMIWWSWKRLVYKLTGAVWVGVPGFRTLRIYPLERYEMHDLPDGNRVMVLKKDFSDHYRVAQFQLGVRVPSADTQDLMPVKVEFNVILRVTNSFLVAFNTDDRWAQRISAAAADAISSFTRTKPVAEVLAISDPTKAREMTDEVTRQLSRMLGPIGIEVTESQYVDISPTDPSDANMLGDKARAKVYKDSRELRAEGDAAPVRKIGQALKDFPEAAQIPGIDGIVRAVEAAGDRATIFLGDPRTINPLDAAQLAELRRLTAPTNPAGGP